MIGASILLADQFDGPVRHYTVVHRSAAAVQVADERGRWSFSVTFPGSVRLPCACAVVPPVSASSSLSVGDGVLTWGSDVYAVNRWWRPTRPGGDVFTALAPRISEAAADRLLRSWTGLLGRGPGLTPYGDDVLCGALMTLSATGHPALTPLRSQLQAADLEARTTITSAGLLRTACEGWCIDQLADYLRALTAAPAAGPPTPALATAVTRLTAVGSSSGRGLLAGVAWMVPSAAVGPTWAAEAVA